MTVAAAICATRGRSVSALGCSHQAPHALEADPRLPDLHRNGVTPPLACRAIAFWP